jgi:superfamily II DNA or RNA helicase
MPKAQHPKAASFVRQNLFAGLKTFAEFEARIEKLSDEQSRGDAFEVFAEAYLATQRKHDAANVWPLNAVPSLVLQKLGLATKDYGIDGVFETQLAHYSAYQAKFRTNRPSLTWRELSTFMGLADSPEIRSRVLFTNCDDLPSVLNDRQGFFCIRGSDLDRLEVDDFRAIEAWLADAAFTASRKQPLPHQMEALDALLPALETHDRVTAIMACGTGKTLVSLWVAERRQPSKILVLVPSLALLRQMLHEWLRETSFTKLAYHCVCSDSTVKDGLDAIATAQSDLDFQVSTDSVSVRKFLDAHFEGTKIVFSTYQSARVVGMALKPEESFDFAVFDEAHKTAGREGRNFAIALEDTNLSIRKRLFMTATPRHYNPRKQNQEGEAQLVFSMDRSDVYGPQAYCLTFAEAARRQIICGYKVVISVITSDMVSNEILSRGEVLVKGDAVRARQVANQIALRDAIEQYGARKAFTFHRTVASAASFVADGSEGIRNHMPDFEAFHVNGAMSTASREREMRDFRNSDRAIMSNARCLTEGVDVPAVDMVAFLSPRRSRVDIVQATGRAMRLSPGKTTGYVLVPLYVEQATNETVEEAVNRSSYDEVWEVLNSLQEQDDVLAEIIRYAGEQRGAQKGVDDSRLSDRVDVVGIPIELEALRSAVVTRCFGAIISSWDVFFGKLASYKDRFGHCNVETDWGEDSYLGKWVVTQRIRKKKNALSSEQIARLNTLGFVWNWQELKGQETWMKWYRELEKYTLENGNPHIPARHPNSKLASWVWIQRQRRKGTYKTKGAFDLITDEQIHLLDALGFHWDARYGRASEYWLKGLEQLKKFREQHGHCNLSKVEKCDDRLKAWASYQRARIAQDKIDPDHKAQLDALDFSSTRDAIDYHWNQMYERLKQYHATNGSADVPNRWPEDIKLASWVSQQRQRRKNNQLSQDEFSLLDELKFTWQFRERGSWDDRLAELIQFKAKNGHFEVPLNCTEVPKLGRFVRNMRAKRNNVTLLPDRIAKLDGIGFNWVSSKKVLVGGEGITAEWQASFDELLEYYETHGSCNVPYTWPQNPRLAHWVSRQRHLKRQKKLHPKREEKLKRIGFNWNFENMTPNK